MFRLNYYGLRPDKDKTALYYVRNNFENSRKIADVLKKNSEIIYGIIGEKYLDFEEGIYFCEKDRSADSTRIDKIINEFESREDKDILKEVRSKILVVSVESSSYIMSRMLRNLLKSISDLKDSEEREGRWRNPVNALSYCFSQDYRSEHSGSDIARASTLLLQDQQACKFVSLETCLSVVVQHDFDEELAKNNLFLIIGIHYSSRVNCNLKYLWNSGILDVSNVRSLESTIINYKDSDTSRTKVARVVSVEPYDEHFSITAKSETESFEFKLPSGDEYPEISLNRTFSITRDLLNTFWSDFSRFEMLRNKENKISTSEAFSRISSLISSRLENEIKSMKVSGTGYTVVNDSYSLVDNLEEDIP
jgi:hypothetical protein